MLHHDTFPRHVQSFMQTVGEVTWILMCPTNMCHFGMHLAAMYEDIKEYLNWYDTRKDMTFAKDAPIIGLVLQRSHLVTGDEGHYSGVVSEMEARGAKVGQLVHL